jgi:hypothetical protein
MLRPDKMILTNHSDHSATFKTDDSIKQPISPIVRRRSLSSCRRVSFNERRNKFYTNTNKITVEELHVTWYTNEEYLQFRSGVRKLVGNTLKEAENDYSRKVFLNVLEELYKAVGSVDFVLHDAMVILTPAQKHNLYQLFNSNENLNLIGLDYHISESLKKDAVQRREEIQDVVCTIQSEYDSGIWNEVQVVDELRDSCLNFSQAACLFAQMVAKAQLAA